MKQRTFSLRELLTAGASVAVASLLFSSWAEYGRTYYDTPGRRPPRSSWPADAPVLESVLFIALLAVLIFLPANSIITNLKRPFWMIDSGYWLFWFVAFLIFLFWYNIRAAFG